MLNKLAKEIANWRLSKSFYTPDSLNTISQRDDMLGKLMLVVSEVSEIAEAVRHNNIENFKEEIADTFIRLLDICGTMKIDVEKAISNKMELNRKIPQRHDTHTSL